MILATKMQGLEPGLVFVPGQRYPHTGDRPFIGIYIGAEAHPNAIRITRRATREEYLD